MTACNAMNTVRHPPLRVWAALVVLAVLSVPALAASRVALVIGNADYAHAPALANPLNDAADVGAALKRLGFSVTRLDNADSAAILRALRGFTRAASGSEVSVVFYAGHGIEVDQRNFLVPVDARLASDHDVEFETVPLDLVVRAAARASRLRLVILDACRENPFAAQMQRAGSTRSIGRGLARVEPTGSTLVAYAAKGGTVAADGTGRNSPFTEALLEHLEEPGLEVGMMFRRVRDAVLASTHRQQEPFVYGSLSSQGAYLAAAPEPSSGRQPGADEELAARAYEAAERLDTVEGYEAVMRRFPGSVYAELARSRLRQLDGESKGSAPQGTAESAAAPTVDEAVAAYERGDYATALEGFRVHAEQGNAFAQDYLGIMYRDGMGVAQDNDEAVRWFRLAAEQGNAVAQTNLGFMYGTGSGVARNDAEAVRWFRLAAEQGNAVAQDYLGIMYRDGMGVAQDNDEAVRWFRKGAEQGYAFAQANLGFMYQNGAGVARNDAEAVHWYRLAAEQGNAFAQDNLGIMYRDGMGVAQDNDEAVRWFRKGAEQGYAFAQANLGFMYQNGAGVARNDAEAVRWYRLAAEQGNAFAQDYLGVMYRDGMGVAQDNDEAVRWFRLAAEQGNVVAQTNLGFMYGTGSGVARNDAEAVRWFRLAAEQGNAVAQDNLGVMYRDGIGVAQDNDEAVRWFRKGAEQGFANAQASLGFMYGTGSGVARNDAEAVRLYRLAAEQGNAVAQNNLGVMYENGTGVSRSDAEAVRWYRMAAEQGDANAESNLRRLGLR